MDFTCKICNLVRSSIMSSSVANVCRDCLRRCYRRCSGCQRYRLADKMTQVQYHLYCLNCLGKCEICHAAGRVRAADLKVFGRKSVCLKCEILYGKSPTLTHSDKQPQGGILHRGMSWDNPVTIFGFVGESKDNLYMGIELEMEFDVDEDQYDNFCDCSDCRADREECDEGDEPVRPGLWTELANRIKYEYLPEFCVTKEDGSLEGGIEVVTPPATLDVHKQRWDGFFKKNRENRLPFCDRGNAGMHIHLSRAGLSVGQIGRMLTFLNHRDNYRFVKKIADRDVQEWAAVDEDRAHVTAPLHGTIGKYAALNTCPSETVEMRIFRSPYDNASRFFSNLEFAHSLSKFCAPGVVSIQDVHDKSLFTNFVSESRKTYPNLYKTLAA